jgi:hypothetical protein
VSAALLGTIFLKPVDLFSREPERPESVARDNAHRMALAVTDCDTRSILSAVWITHGRLECRD